MGNRISSDSTRPRPALVLLAVLTLATVACVRADGDSRPAAVQVAEAVLAAPPSLREEATVLGYDGAGLLTTLRQGEGPLVCLADDPAEAGFHVACYHESLDPFMARGRELRRSGVEGERVDSVRLAEVRDGVLPMPDHPAALYNLDADAPPANPAAGPPENARRLHVLYLPNATPEQVGLSTDHAWGGPWMGSSGTAKAHVMFAPE